MNVGCARACACDFDTVSLFSLPLTHVHLPGTLSSFFACVCVCSFLVKG